MNADKIYETVMKEGLEWADRNAAAEMLEETRKTVLAELGNRSGESSMAAKEAWALTQPEYRLHLTNQITARKEANRARVRYDSAKLLAELRRSEESTRRAEINLR